LLIYAEGREMFFFFDFLRIHFVGILAVVFFLLILFFGRAKGFTSLIALGFTCASIFFMFIPAILSGWNIYLATAVLCAYAVLFTLLLVVGPNAKAISATLGCFGGVLFAALLMLLTSEVLRISGLVDSTSQQLFVLPTPRPLDLRAIVFAGVIIGAVGAIMDVAMSIASALWEIGDSGGAKDFAGFFKAGINIGRDIMGTMLNTLILAYIGSSMTMILLLTGSTLPMLQLLNSEQIVVELIRALVGSFGMLLAIPLTAAICAWVYPRFMRVADTTDTH
ncbi:MAG: YibE/F family protein, partial [Defluviitaleaceae bacterium]|nr:YibE/F family protein [Defluviitaleaceae bacterium]